MNSICDLELPAFFLRIRDRTELAGSANAPPKGKRQAKPILIPRLKRNLQGRLKDVRLESSICLDIAVVAQ